MSWPNRGRKRGYWLNIALGIDQSAGTILGIDADESISSWCGRNKPGRWQERFINWLFRNPNHCKDSIERHLNCN